MKRVSVVLHPLSPICSAIDVGWGLRSTAAVVMEAVLVKGKPTKHHYMFMPRGLGGSREAFDAMKEAQL